MARFKRRQLFVHPLQYWFVVTALIYFSCMLVVLYGIVFLPMVQLLDDPSATWQARDQAATQFLDFNARVWPWLLVTFLGLLLHSIYFMHRIAGPLYRFTALFRTIGTGNLHVRAHLREHDYLHREAQDFNAMLDRLEQKVELLNAHCATVTKAYEDVARLVREKSPGHANAALEKLEEELHQFRASIEEFTVRALPPPQEQQGADSAAPSAMDSSANKKAA
jgi:methyl-accepting chemotaxis protein